MQRIVEIMDQMVYPAWKRDHEETADAVDLMLSLIVFSAEISLPVSSRLSTVLWLVRSRPNTFSATSTAARIWQVMERVMADAKPAPTRIDIAPRATSRFRPLSYWAAI